MEPAARATQPMADFLFEGLKQGACHEDRNAELGCGSRCTRGWLHDRQLRLCSLLRPVAGLRLSIGILSIGILFAAAVLRAAALWLSHALRLSVRRCGRRPVDHLHPAAG